MEIIRKTGNEIHKSIEIETDTTALHEDKKIPILDLKVWTETRKEAEGKITSKIVHEFYHREIGSKHVTSANSAMSEHAIKEEYLNCRNVKSNAQMQPPPRMERDRQTRK